MKVKLWVVKQHDDYTVIKVETNYTSLIQFSNDTMREGGIRYGDGFIPWHRINYLEEVENCQG